MQTVGPPDTHHLSAAMGWMELGNLVEARAELAKVAPELIEHPAVLEVTWALEAAALNWPEALRTAEQLVRNAGDRASGWLHLAYALRRAPGGGLEAAWKALLPAVDRFPEEATIPYNLACYACQLGQLDEARRWLQRALGVGERAKIKSMASSDSDLEPLWSEIKGL
jgi:tetratricopeptide (TPR) repeat protein